MIAWLSWFSTAVYWLITVPTALEICLLFFAIGTIVLVQTMVSMITNIRERKHDILDEDDWL